MRLNVHLLIVIVIMCVCCVQRTSGGLPLYRAVCSADEPSVSTERGRQTAPCCRLRTAGGISVAALSQAQRPRPTLPHDPRHQASSTFLLPLCFVSHGWSFLFSLPLCCWIYILTAVLLGCVASRPVIGWQLRRSNSTQITEGVASRHVTAVVFQMHAGDNCWYCYHLNYQYIVFIMSPWSEVMWQLVCCTVAVYGHRDTDYWMFCDAPSVSQ